MQGHVAIVGASGVIGTAAVGHFGRAAEWRVTSMSRRKPIVMPDVRHSHVALDLEDRDGCRKAVSKLPPITHLIYAAVKEKPGLVAGWSDPETIAENGRMFEAILDAVAAQGQLRHVLVLQGTKAYGGLYHPVMVPAKEDRPRDDHPNFYWLHEDYARKSASIHGFAVTIFRPQIVLGDAPGVVMNPVLPFGAYAALCRELDMPFAYPGAKAALWEMTDAPLLAQAFDWAFETPAAQGQIFNVTNGDVLVLADVWREFAAALGHTDGGAKELNFAEFFGDPSVQEAWRRIAHVNNLLIDDLQAFVGESHHYADLLLGPRIASRAIPVLVSTIKLRKTGFGECRDSLDSFLAALGRLEDLRLLPRLRRF
jgi:nucleoside-diphosphate-sugar epimerase